MIPRSAQCNNAGWLKCGCISFSGLSELPPGVAVHFGLLTTKATEQLPRYILSLSIPLYRLCGHFMCSGQCWGFCALEGMLGGDSWHHAGIRIQSLQLHRIYPLAVHPRHGPRQPCLDSVLPFEEAGVESVSNAGHDSQKAYSAKHCDNGDIPVLERHHGLAAVVDRVTKCKY